uniref:Uncharacterized protein n=1 Tax=Anguilla anguilla TaxID=7936 RepID=A0A0E9VZI2_ANGAN
MKGTIKYSLYRHSKTGVLEQMRLETVEWHKERKSCLPVRATPHNVSLSDGRLRLHQTIFTFIAHSGCVPVQVGGAIMHYSGSGAP